MKYPYIGQCYSAMILFYAEGEGLVLDDALGFDENTKVGDKVTLHGGTNITREYLQNKKVKVESQEHLEFLYKLSVAAGYDGGCTDITFTDNYPWFAIVDDEPNEINEVFSVFHELEQITIPLPPKESNTSSGECYGRKTDDKWPRVGDKVTWGSCVANAEAIATHNKTAWVLNEHGSYENVEIAKLKKPKTEAEILREEVTESIWKLNDKWTANKASMQISVQEFIATELIKSYNITKKPQ